MTGLFSFIKPFCHISYSHYLYKFEFYIFYKREGDRHGIENKQTQRSKVDELMQTLQEGVVNAYSSAKYQQLLRAVSKLHHYSINNQILLFAQKEDVSMCMGFNAWKSLGYVPRRGEHGLKVLAPAFYKQEVEQTNEDGTTEKVLIDRERYKIAYTFDVSQVVNIKTGQPYPELTPELSDPVADYFTWFAAVESVSPVPIRFGDTGHSKGYYSDKSKEIVISEKIRGKELQVLKTLTHEVVHARLHSGHCDVDKASKEIQAESIAYILTSALQMGDTSEYSFPYLQSWSSGKDVKELKASLDVIRQESNKMLEEITQKIQLSMHREMELPKIEGQSMRMAL